MLLLIYRRQVIDLMRLKFIKLAGFKSFVEPTKVSFERQITAVVGPNGCGKSNIIDAVRWVLGESSAKNLRGEAMTDVIFNGAASRKPIGQASVELFFDNVAGRLTGSMADRNEISIRRVVNRDSNNTYYLNGSKCRRKDITDIFLGTGLGPRSYAIIEQGTISKLIESKPQELRVFIEEAAGISKYKERRRETETRIRHTRENLQRLNDIRNELSHQIDRLQQQAKDAKYFKKLKNQQRHYKAELAVLRWQKYNQHSEQAELEQVKHQQKIAQYLISQEQQRLCIAENKQKLESSQEHINQLQQQQLLLSNNIARAELHLKHGHENQVKMEQELQVCQQQLIKAQHSLLDAQAKLEKSSAALITINPQIDDVEQQIEALTLIYQRDVRTQQEQQAQWQVMYQQQANSENEKILSIKNIAEQELIIAQAAKRLTEIDTLLQALSKPDECTINKNKQLVASLIDQVAEFTEQKNELLTLLDQNYQAVVTSEQQKAELNASKSSQQLLLKQLQSQQSKEFWLAEQHQWLAQCNVNCEGMLFTQLDIKQGWQQSVELVLSHYLLSEVVTELPDIALLCEQSNQKNQPVKLPSTLSLTKRQTSTVASNEQHKMDNKNATPYMSLTDIIGNGMAFPEPLASIYCVDTIDQAKELLQTLGDDKSVLCKNATWLSKSFIRKGKFIQQSDTVPAILMISEAQVKQQKNTESLKNCQQKLSMLRQEKQTYNQQLDVLTTEIDSIQQQVHGLNQGHALARQAAKNSVQQQQLYQQEQKQVIVRQSLAKQALTELKQSAKEPSKAILAKEQVIDFNQSLQVEQQKIHVQHTQLQELVKHKHQLQLQLEKNNNIRQYYCKDVLAIEQQIHLLTAKQQDDSQQILQHSEPLNKDQQALQQWLIELKQLESELLLIQQKIVERRETTFSLEQNYLQGVESIADEKQLLNKSHIAFETNNFKTDAALQTLQDTGLCFNAIQQNMPGNANDKQWQIHLNHCSAEIRTLGAINLAAIDEYESQLTRKNTLDQQDQDLSEAISTLELAIDKIDSQSKQQFKSTFEQVNNGLQTLFPKVFGGGGAYLALTGDNMLETGVKIMARPPGKKNSTIHSLSGGEKALTALSLVFTIFRLNPAPFCMLDEVDAPLDDANVNRFCNLVREMSQTVQFVYISHNKIAIEMATHLTGVTMFEPGVSKMVAVDIDEAIATANVSPE